MEHAASGILVTESKEIIHPKANLVKSIKEKYLSYDEQVIPALRNQNRSSSINPDENESPAIENQQKNIDAPITEDAHRFADPLIPFLNEEICKKLFSKNWALREEALKIIGTELHNPETTILNMNDPNALYVAILGAISFTITDNINQVSQRAMKLLQDNLKFMKQIPVKSEFQTYLDSTLTNLLEKIGEQNIRIRDQGISCFMDLARNPIISCNIVITTIIKPSNPTKHKTDNSPKHLIGKLMLMKQMINEFKINNHDIPLNSVVEYLEDKLDNPHSDIRAWAVSLFGDIFRAIGGEKLKAVLKLKPVQMESLEKEFNNPGQALRPSPKAKSNNVKVKEIISNNNSAALFGDNNNNNSQQQSSLQSKPGLQAVGGLKTVQINNNNNQTNNVSKPQLNVPENNKDKDKDKAKKK